jgi:hypothetical protein
VPVSSMLKHVVTRLDGNLYSKKGESKTILSFHLWPSTSAPSPVSRLHPAQSPPNIFSAPVTAHAATHRHPSFPSPPSTRHRLPRRPAAAYPVDLPGGRPTIRPCPDRCAQPADLVVWRLSRDRRSGSRPPALAPASRDWSPPPPPNPLTRPAIVEVKPVLHLPGLLPHRRRHEEADRRRRPAPGGRRGPPTLLTRCRRPRIHTLPPSPPPGNFPSHSRQAVWVQISG